jgi:hypothetical protein
LIIYFYKYIHLHISTVGYGTAAVALSYQNSSRTNCSLQTILASLEALSGTLFAGVCGAILFGKVLRILSHAQVIFSDPILIRYGKGVRADNNDTECASSTTQEQQQLPFPVLEFRIVNRLNDEDGGEIVDASVQIVAKIDHEDKVLDTGISSGSIDFDNNNNNNNDNNNNIDSECERQQDDNRIEGVAGDDISAHTIVGQMGKLFLEKIRQRQKSGTIISQSWHGGGGGNSAPFFASDSTAPCDTFDPNIETNISKSHHPYNKLFASMPPVFNNNTIPSRNNQAASDNKETSMIGKEDVPIHDIRSPLKRAITRQTSTSFVSGTASMNISTRNSLLLRSVMTANTTSKQTTMSHQQYYKINVESPEHPFFKRVWMVRHILDGHSPIVKHRVKMAIKRNNGCWPYNRFNTYTDIIDSLHFNHIIVSLNGVSNVSASTVYAQKI